MDLSLAPWIENGLACFGHLDLSFPVPSSVIGLLIATDIHLGSKELADEGELDNYNSHLIFNFKSTSERMH